MGEEDRISERGQDQIRSQWEHIIGGHRGKKGVNREKKIKDQWERYDQRSSEESRSQYTLPAYESVSGASPQKQGAPQTLKSLQNAPSPENKKGVGLLDHAQEIHFNFQSQGCFGYSNRGSQCSCGLE
jgi:hypothetical protein